MDSLATWIAVAIVLTVPFLLWFRLKARTKYERELSEIKTLAAERTRLLMSLHSRLDVSERESPQQESVMSGKSNRPLFTTSTFSSLKNKDSALEEYYLALKERDIAIEKYHLTVLGAMGTESASRMYPKWLNETQSGRDWQYAAVYGQSKAEGLRWKKEWRRRNHGPTSGSTLQLS